ncbi:hypothetical protein AURANDRAFT_71504, partial [Aureococcus anophagefferens]
KTHRPHHPSHDDLSGHVPQSLHGLDAHVQRPDDVPAQEAQRRPLRGAAHADRGVLPPRRFLRLPRDGLLHDQAPDGGGAHGRLRRVVRVRLPLPVEREVRPLPGEDEGQVPDALRARAPHALAHGRRRLLQVRLSPPSDARARSPPPRPPGAYERRRPKNQRPL